MPPPWKWRAYAQLVRLPNVFTALADISVGCLTAWTTGALWPQWPRFLCLLAGSACLYSSGMVWNDFFDVEQDRRERPFRPLPSGRVSRSGAGWFGATLAILGLALALLAGWASFYTACVLVLAIFLYDAWLKRTPMGPVSMGACRFLNILLGLSLLDAAAVPWNARLFVALVVGLYIAGVTWFARTEARMSNRQALMGSAGVMLAALVLALSVPVWFDPAASSPLFPYLLVALGFFLAFPASQAMLEPTPPRVQRAVKRALIGLVVLDAVLGTALAGIAGLFILILLLPTLYLGRWIYST
jgi:4-hydroxybenzoate polyprenyltransferase